jgi:pyruvate formate lyase activating enzyme
LIPGSGKEIPPTIDKDKLMDYLVSKRKWIEGICITGGEPTIHSELQEFIRELKQNGFSVKLDTNGSNPRMLEKLIKENLVDYIALDIKNTFEKYEETIGVKLDLEKIKKSIEIVRKSDIDYEFRTTVVPNLHTKEDIEKIALMVKGAKIYFLQTFNPQKTLDPKFEKIKPFSRGEMEELAKICEKYVPTKIR